jgi:GNAT superfamily N-acetyltransferase
MQGLMELIKPSIAGLASRGMYAAISREATRQEDLIIAIAEAESGCVGLLAAVLNWPRFWRGFLWRYPLLALRIFAGRMWRGLRHLLTAGRAAQVLPDAVAAALAPGSSGRTWRDYSPSIAKGLYIAAVPSRRATGIGEQMCNYVFRELSNRGISRMDGLVEIDNIASVKLCQKTGWRLERAGDALLISIDLPPGNREL